MNTWLLKNEISVIESNISNLKNEVKDLNFQYNKIQDNYISLLEKTNTQLELWWTPWWVYLSVFSILFTILGIVAWIVIYFISLDYKQQQQKFEEESKKLIKDTNNIFLESIEKFNSQIEGAKNQNIEIEKIKKDLVEAINKEINPVKKKELENELDNLNEIVIPQTYFDLLKPLTESLKQQNILENRLYPIIVHKCSNCESEYQYRKPFLNVYSQYTTCPKCNQKDKI